MASEENKNTVANTAAAFAMGGPLAGGATLLSGILQSKSASKAAKLQAGASAAATREQRRQFDLSRSDQMPWQTAGATGLSELTMQQGLDTQIDDVDAYNTAKVKYETDLAAINSMPRWTRLSRNRITAARKKLGVAPQQSSFMKAQDNTAYAASQQPAAFVERPNTSRTDAITNLKDTPGYQFRLDQGLQGVERSAAARGGLFSGATLKGLDEYAQDYASNEYAKEYDRTNNEYAEQYNRDSNTYNRDYSQYSDKLNRLSSLSGLGQQTATNLGTLGQNYATNVGNIGMSNANAQGAAQIARGNVFGSTISGLGNIYANSQSGLPPTNQPARQPSAWRT